ncbi:peptidase C14, caspase domain-containing protein [Earliella scabrosa]|nr:peptidase C14, caspase domain-containing protein [Earliella scabrosa]
MPGVSRVSGRAVARKALLIGIQYENNPTMSQNGQTIPGAHNDPQILRDLLIEHYEYKDEDITILIDSDDDDESHACPTRENILAAMRNLVADARPGDRFVFSFSGHGSQVVNEDGTEEDGFDETLITADTTYDPLTETYSKYIKDDLVKQILVDSLPPGAHLVMIFDCCHSGTASDLPAVVMDNFTSPCSPITTRPRLCCSRGFAAMNFSAADCDACRLTGRSGKSRYNSLPLESPLPDVTSWSACMDSQITYGGRRGGMFIKAFSDALTNEPHQTHAQLLQSIRRELAKRTSKHTIEFTKRGLTEHVTTPRAQVRGATPLFASAVERKG